MRRFSLSSPSAFLRSGCRYQVAVAAVLLGVLVTPAPANAQGVRAVGKAMKQSEQSTQQLSSEEKAVQASEQALSKIAAWRIDEAATMLDNMPEEQRQTAHFNTATAMLRAARGKLDEAVDLLRDAAADVPTDPAPLYYRGEVLFWKQNWDGAESAWTAAFDAAKSLASTENENARAHYYKGVSAVRLKKFQVAHAALDRAHELDFDERRVLFQRGLAFALQEKWGEARDALNELAEADSRFAHLYFYRGIALSKLGKKDQMLIDMDQFIKLAPGAPEADTAQSYLAAAGR